MVVGKRFGGLMTLTLVFSHRLVKLKSLDTLRAIAHWLFFPFCSLVVFVIFLDCSDDVVTISFNLWDHLFFPGTHPISFHNIIFTIFPTKMYLNHKIAKMCTTHPIISLVMGGGGGRDSGQYYVLARGTSSHLRPSAGSTSAPYTAVVTPYIYFYFLLLVLQHSCASPWNSPQYGFISICCTNGIGNCVCNEIMNK